MTDCIKENQDSTPKFTFFSSMHGMLPRKLRKLKSFLTIVDETKSKEQEGNDQIHKSTNPLSNTVLKITGSKKKSKEESESILRQVKMKLTNILRGKERKGSKKKNRYIH